MVENIVCRLSDNWPCTFQWVQQKHSYLARLHKIFLLQKAKCWQDQSHSDMVVIISKVILYHLENLKQRKRSLKWLIDIQVLLTEGDDTPQKRQHCFEFYCFALAWHVLLDIFKQGSADRHQEISDSFHEILTMLRKCRSHAVLDKRLTHLILEIANRWCSSLLLCDDLKALERHFPVLCKHEFQKVWLEDGELWSVFWLQIRQLSLGTGFKSDVLGIIADDDHLVLSCHFQQGHQRLQCANALGFDCLIVLEELLKNVCQRWLVDLYDNWGQIRTGRSSQSLIVWL